VLYYVMLLNVQSWYLFLIHSGPSAGSVTKVSAIPNTSLFLTGSKDGDVKLWDAKKPQMVFHWPKLHERHTFFQPTSRGFGSVVRVCNTRRIRIYYFLLTRLVILSCYHIGLLVFTIAFWSISFSLPFSIFSFPLSFTSF
jgi:WD40 repeat protein